MITSNLYSMSVKKLSARLSVLLVACAFAVSAKALVAQPAYMDGSMGFYIQLEDGDKLNGGGPAELQTAIFNDPDMTPAGFEGDEPTYKQGIFKDADGKRFLRYRSASGIPNDIYLSDIEKIKIKTADGVTLGKGEIEQLESYTSLKYVDLENCAFKNEIKNSNVSNPLAGLSKRSSTLETIVFPVTDGMIIPENVFNGDKFPNLHTIIIPDHGAPTVSTSAGSSTETPKYYIANNAFKGSNLERVSLGYGFTDQNGTNAQGQPNWVGSSMFSHCESLKTVVLNNYIPSLPPQAFEYTYSLEYVDLPMYLSHIGDLCFKWSGLKTVTIPDYIEILGNSSPQIFQYCLNLSDIYVNTDNVKVKNQGLFEDNQTKITYTGNGIDQWGYQYYQNNSGSSPYNGAASPNTDTFGEGSRTGQLATVLHYPGTLTSRQNYRVPCMFYYHGVDEATGTTWPTNNDFNNLYNGWNDPDGNYQAGYAYNHGGTYQDNINNSEYGGWRQFKLGAQNIKEQDVFYENRVTEARWYTVCYPMDLTKTQFESAYGIGADLRVFSSATYNADKNAVVLNFDQHETEDADGVYLKRNVPYMVHPARLNYREEKILNRVVENGEFKGYEYEKETIYINGVAYERDKSREVLAFYNIESDLFARKNADGSDDEDAIQDAIDASESKLDDKMVWQHCDGVDQNMDFTYRGNYQKPGGSYAKTIPAGAFYLGMWPGEPETLGFYKSDGSVSWPQYVAAILPGTKTENTSGSSTSGTDAGAKLDVSFFGEDVVDVTTEIIDAPQIQINIIKASDKVYNMNGQVVLDSAKDMKSLPKGIYIVNGRKIAVK